MALKKIYRACQKLGSVEGLDLTKAKKLKQYTKVQKLVLINPMSCSNSEDSEQEFKQPEQERDEDVFESEESDDDNYQ